MNLKSRILNLSVGLVAVLSFRAGAAEITGAGSTFVYPLMAKWAQTYKAKTGTSVNYQSIGSGGGIKQIEAKTIDFGATDKPLSSEELTKESLVQFPIVSGGVVPVINVKGLKAGELKLTGPVLADIFLGKIKMWNDPQIVSLNPGMTLPSKAITVVHRADGSGTSFIWTNYLSKTSPDWKTKVGEGTAVKWPTGVGGKGNEGVGSYVQRIQGSIGYVEYAFALQTKLSFAQVKNHSGHFVAPNIDTFKAAASGADWAHARDFALILTDAPGEKSWPIAGSTFALIQKNPAKPEQGKAVLEFFKWAYANGGSMAKELDYVAMPPDVVKLIEKSWSQTLKIQPGKAPAR